MNINCGKLVARRCIVSGGTLILAMLFLSCSAATTAPASEVSSVERPTVKYATTSPAVISFANTPEARVLKDSIAAAGDYMVRYQLSSGELSYRVDITDSNRSYSPSHIRLIAGTGSLYTVCRVTEDLAYCDAGDRALDYYLNRLIEDRDKFDGSCLYSRGYCKLGGEALALDAIHKRWQATGDTSLGNRDLLEIAQQLGEHIVWMRDPEGGFFHRIDPFEGTVDEEYFVTYFNGESLMALLELFEMTGDEYWLEQAHEVNAYMRQQPIAEDHWHGYAFSFIARLDTFTREDQIYATRIAQAIISNESNLDIEHSSISTASKVEALAAIALAFQIQGDPQDWLAPAIKEHVDFVMARQLPNNLCGWQKSDNIKRFEGGIYCNCEDPYIRVDALQHWINGAATYLEYLSFTLPLE